MEERRMLDSWKEISAYLNRSVMTCHRWEEQLGLPVHRLDGTPKARVFAYADELDRWLTDKLHTAEPVENGARPAARPKGKWALALGGSLVVLAAVTAAGRYLYYRPLPAPAQVPSMVVLPFENRTGDPAWDAWKMALADLITIDLRQSKFLDVIKTSNLFQAAGALAEAGKFSPDDIRKVAEKAEVGYVLTGSVSRSGEDIVITALVRHGLTGDVMGSPRSTCRDEKGVFSSVDELSRAVKSALNISPREIRGDIDHPVADITTSSPEAFRLYSQSYRVQGKLKFDEAVSPVLKAVGLDPKFGLAYRGLFHYCRAVSRKEESRKFGEMAVRYADRIAEREREVFLHDYYGSEQPDKEKMVQAYRRLGKSYPYDRPMIGLARFYMDQEEWDKAVPILERLILRYPKGIPAIQQLATCYQSLGLYEKAEKLLDDQLRADPGPGMETAALLSSRWRLAVVQDKFDVAHRCADRLMAAFPDDLSYCSDKGFIYFLQDDLPNAEKMYRQLAASDGQRTQMRGFEYLAAVSLSRGRIEEARQRILRAIELAKGLRDRGPDVETQYHYFLAHLERLSGRLPEALREADLACGGDEHGGLASVRILHLKALITLEMNQLEEFDKQAAVIKECLQPDRFIDGAPRFLRVYDNLLGHSELQKGHYDLAIRHYWKSLDLLSVLAADDVDADHAKYFYDLAEAYRRSGDPWNALAMYEKVVLPTVSREYSGDLYARSHYQMGLEWERRMGNMGTLAEVRERRLKAIGYYRKFLELWKDADPIFPEVEDAKNRLARLETEQERADGLPRKN